jgi:chromosome segregation ATPase
MKGIAMTNRNSNGQFKSKLEIRLDGIEDRIGGVEAAAKENWNRIDQRINGLAADEEKLKAVKEQLNGLSAKLAEIESSLARPGWDFEAIKNDLQSLGKSLEEQNGTIEAFGQRITSSRSAINAQIEELKQGSAGDVVRLRKDIDGIHDSLAYHRWGMAGLAIVLLVAEFVILFACQSTGGN